jgi:hypothetical protein
MWMRESQSRCWPKYEKNTPERGVGNYHIMPIKPPSDRANHARSDGKAKLGIREKRGKIKLRVYLAQARANSRETARGRQKPRGRKCRSRRIQRYEETGVSFFSLLLHVATHVATPTISGEKARHGADKREGFERTKNISEQG